MLATPNAIPRVRVDEMMDRPDLSPAEHRVAFAGLRRINRLSRVARSMLPHVLAVAREQGKPELQLLDVACGCGDVPVNLARLALTHGVRIRLVLVDRAYEALELAQAAARVSGIPSDAAHIDVMSDVLPQADIVTNSLFLHHLDPPGAVAVLSRLKAAARHLLLVSDLKRTRLHLTMAAMTCYTLTRSRVVRHDGPASVRAAFTIAELRHLANLAQLTTAEVHPVWPCRMLLCWRRPGG